jgi:hypothetical protein
MITVISPPNGPPLVHQVIVRGLPIYLDNDSLIELAKGDAGRRQRFITALHGGADLMFSMTNAVELVGPLGRSSLAVRSFLSDVGPHWFPVGIDLGPVLDAEANGADPRSACVSSSFVKSYFTDRTSGYFRGSGKVISLSGDFFNLGAVVDWLQPQRATLLAGAGSLDTALFGRVDKIVRDCATDGQLIDRYCPVLTFTPSMPATFAHTGLVRCLVQESKSYHLKKGDGCDFSHAVMGSAFASFATLDKQWKRRVETLPQPHGLARIYYRPELDTMVADIEAALLALP